MPTRTKRNAQPKTAGALTAEEPQPERSLDELRREMALKLARMVGRKHWPTCPRRGCRRHRSCEAPNYMCANVQPPKLTPEQRAQAMADLRRMLARRLAAVGQEG